MKLQAILTDSVLVLLLKSITSSQVIWFHYELGLKKVYSIVATLKMGFEKVLFQTKMYVVDGTLDGYKTT